jgi:hypothetical protein
MSVAGTDDAAAGKARRSSTPRSSHAGWEPASDRPDPIQVLEDQAKTRIAELVPIRYGRMLESPFAFFRGAAAVMAHDLSGTRDSGFRVQLCGDAHLSNFGGFASPERRLVFDLNDFDETLPGPWEWDVKRLAASIAVAGRDLGFDAEERAACLLGTARRFRTTMREFAEMRNLDVWYAHLDVDAVQERWGKEVSSRRRREFQRNVAKAHSKDSMKALSRLAHRVNGQLRIIGDPPLIVPVEELAGDVDPKAIEGELQRLLASYLETLRGAARHLIAGYRYAHAARKVVGVGSVGTRAWIVLLLGRNEDDPLFLQVKEAQASVLEPFAGPSVFEHHGRRVVEGQWLMQAVSDISLGWIRGPEGRDFYVRQLWDWKRSVDLAGMTPKDLGIYGEICAWTLARAHARSGDRAGIAGYLGSGDVFDQAIAEFAERYADQNERDHEQLKTAQGKGRIAAQVEA